MYSHCVCVDNMCALPRQAVSVLANEFPNPMNLDFSSKSGNSHASERAVGRLARGFTGRGGRFAGFVAALFVSLVVTSFTVTAQNPYSSLGQESLLIGNQLGDQVRPDVDIAATGGYVVWQDSLADEEGFGIQARRLDGSLQTPFAGFRVNQVGEGIQEKPRVAMLANGGAVFVWQHTSGSDTDIRARFVDSDGVFITGDLVVNSHSLDAQRNPKVAALKNGGAVVVWDSVEQDGSLYGVYGQRFGSNGARIGGEFQINETTANNQRNPDVAALAGGGFAVAWINGNTPTVQNEAAAGGESGSVQLVNRIHAYGRVYDASGAPATSEFRLDTNDNIAASPALAATSNGGFTATWTELQSNNAQANYDVHLRSFDASGAPISDQVPANQHTSGVQHSPVIAASGDTLLVVWTSYGQDGSQEGVYGRFVTQAGQFEGDEFAVNTLHTASKQMHPGVDVDANGRMIVAWTTFLADTSFDLFVKRYSSGGVPTPQAPLVYRHDSQSLHVSWPSVNGYDAVEYLLFVDGASEANVVTSGTHRVIGGLVPGSSHSFRIAYRLPDGSQSDRSPAAVSSTWGPDAGNDGLPDEWQARYWGANPASWPANANADSDNDGVSDLNEFLSGTDPTDAGSRLSAELGGAAGGMKLSWTAMKGAIYRVEKSSDYKAWTVVQEVMAADAAVNVPLSNDGQNMFYRIVLQR